VPTIIFFAISITSSQPIRKKTPVSYCLLVFILIDCRARVFSLYSMGAIKTLLS